MKPYNINTEEAIRITLSRKSKRGNDFGEYDISMGFLFFSHAPGRNKKTLRLLENSGAQKS